MPDQPITAGLVELRDGNPDASSQLFTMVYDELKQIARQKMSSEALQHTLQPTALVHEVYLRLANQSETHWENRGHFFAAAAEAMRRILIESARRKSRIKRGGSLERHELFEPEQQDLRSDEIDLLSLNDALDRLKSVDPDSFQLVSLHYFAGLTIAEAAQSVGLSLRTAHRHWSYARAWLKREMDGGSSARYAHD